MSQRGVIEFSSLSLPESSTEAFLDALLAQGAFGKVYGWGIWQAMNRGLKDLSSGEAMILASGAKLHWRGYTIQQTAKVRWSISRGSSRVGIWDLIDWIQRPMRQGESERDLRHAIKGAATAMGETVNSFYGLGNLASPILRSNSILEHLPERDLGISDQAKQALYGGRIQALKIGTRDYPPVFHYDLNSAYAWALTFLPSLRDAEATEGPYGKVDTPWSICEVEWSISKRQRHQIYPFPERLENGRVYYPREGMGWHWSPLVEEAQRLWPKEVHRARSIEIKNSNERPFPFIQDLFDRRRSEKDALTEKIIRRGMAALWGKLCQKDTEHYSAEFCCPEWAGMATSLVNAMLLRVAMRNPQCVWAFHVDSILCAGLRLPCQIGTGLGEWKEEKFQALEMYCSGLWRGLRENGTWKTKTMGIPPGYFNWDVAREEWNRFGAFGRVPVTYRDFQGMNCVDLESEEWLQCEPREGVVSLRPAGGFKTAEELIELGAGGVVSWKQPDSIDELRARAVREDYGK